MDRNIHHRFIATTNKNVLREQADDKEPVERLECPAMNHKKDWRRRPRTAAGRHQWISFVLLVGLLILIMIDRDGDGLTRAQFFTKSGTKSLPRMGRRSLPESSGLSSSSEGDDGQSESLTPEQKTRITEGLLADLIHARIRAAANSYPESSAAADGLRRPFLLGGQREASSLQKRLVGTRQRILEYLRAAQDADNDGNDDGDDADSQSADLNNLVAGGREYSEAAATAGHGKWSRPESILSYLNRQRITNDM